MPGHNSLVSAPYKVGGHRPGLMEWVSRSAATSKATGDDYDLPDVWLPNDPFRATLTLDGTERGRSAARFLWHDADGRAFPMFMTDVAALIQTPQGVRDGRVDAVWIVVKRGQNYGIAYHGPAPADSLDEINARRWNPQCPDDPKRVQR